MWTTITSTLLTRLRGFKGTVVNRVFPSLHGRSLKCSLIMLKSIMEGQKRIIEENKEE